MPHSNPRPRKSSHEVRSSSPKRGVSNNGAVTPDGVETLETTLNICLVEVHRRGGEEAVVYAYDGIRLIYVVDRLTRLILECRVEQPGAPSVVISRNGR